MVADSSMKLPSRFAATGTAKIGSFKSVRTPPHTAQATSTSFMISKPSFVSVCAENMRAKPAAGLSRSSLNESTFVVTRKRLCNPPASTAAPAHANAMGSARPSIVVAATFVHSTIASAVNAGRFRWPRIPTVMPAIFAHQSWPLVASTPSAAASTKVTCKSGVRAKRPSSHASRRCFSVGCSVLLPLS